MMSTRQLKYAHVNRWVISEWAATVLTQLQRFSQNVSNL